MSLPRNFFFVGGSFTFFLNPYQNLFPLTRTCDARKVLTGQPEIGVISNVLRATASCRRNLAFSTTFTRNQNIFTKYREPPKGFQFSEKVSY